MEFLVRAEQYAEARGHDVFFKWIYSNHRESHGVAASTLLSLSYLYGDDVAHELEYPVA